MKFITLPHSGGPYTLFETTADKTVQSSTVTGLAPGTKYYFRLRTVTNPHTNNQNTVYSEYTSEVSGVTTPPLTWTGTSNAGTTENLMGIWSSENGKVFAVGESGTICYYNGTSWSKMTSPVSNMLTDVWGCSESDIFAVGQGVILHFNGTAWTKMTSPATNTDLFNAVWGTSGTDVFAVTMQKIFHYDGVQWTEQMSAEVSLTDIWGASGTNVFAVGTKIYHYDGEGWTEMNITPSNALQGVWGNSGTDVFAVGYGGLILHYNGTDWTEMNGNTTDDLVSVWGNSEYEVFAAGSSGSIFRYNGTDWTILIAGTVQGLKMSGAIPVLMYMPQVMAGQYSI